MSYNRQSNHNNYHGNNNNSNNYNNNNNNNNQYQQQRNEPRERIVYDGKRMRKAITRRVIDNCTGVLQGRESSFIAGAPHRSSFLSLLQPNPSNIINLIPPHLYGNSSWPANAVCCKFIHLSLNKQRCPVNAVRWIPDGKRLLTGSSTGEFTLWNGSTFNFESLLQAHDSAIRAMSWSHSGNFLITGDHAGVIQVWQPSLNKLKVLSGIHKEPVRQVCWSPNDSKFASASDDGTCRIWDFAQMKEERSLEGHGWDVKSIAWHPWKALLASGSKDNLVKLWDPRTGLNCSTIHGHKSSILDCKFNRNGNWILTSSKEQVVKLYDLRMMKELQSFRSHKKEVNCIAWHPCHEGLFASGGAEGAIHFHLASGSPSIDDSSFSSSSIFDMSSTQLSSSTTSSQSSSQSIDPSAPIGSLEGAHDGIIWSLDWHPLGTILASGSADCSTRFWTRHRPGDTLQDRFQLGKAQADSLGLKDTLQQVTESAAVANQAKQLQMEQMRSIK